ncbi:MAG: glucosaminidase domain-containing protein [Bacteroidales bacterium]|nr:glucosaminidase domain-containing protein [Bacteroidales bacterium]
MKFPRIPFMISFLTVILISCNKHIIPPSLAIAQAIDESGWGTSHFAIEGNCLFGQHTSLHSNGKYIPVKGSNVQMAAFETILQATKGYMHNLNTTSAYHDLREQRAIMRNSNEHIDGNKLADSESHYSERGEAYVKMIQGFIKNNHLPNLDYVKFENHDQEFSIFIKQ